MFLLFIVDDCLIFSPYRDKLMKYMCLFRKIQDRRRQRYQQISWDRAGPPPIWSNPNKAALPNPKYPKHDLRHEKFKQQAN